MEKRSVGSFSQPQSEVQFDKLCVVDPHGEDGDLYLIFLINLDDPSSFDITDHQLSPVFQMSCDHFEEEMAFAFLGSKLYMIGGSDDNFEWQSTAYMLDMANLGKTGPYLRNEHLGNNQGLHLLKEDLVQIKCMNVIKNCPIAISIGESEIVVFSSVLKRNSECNFEVYNSKENRWTTVPEPFDATAGSAFVVIMAYYTHNSYLYISVDSKVSGVYCIDLTNTASGWIAIASARFPYMGKGVRVDDLLYTPRGIYKMSGYDFVLPPGRHIANEIYDLIEDLNNCNRKALVSLVRCQFVKMLTLEGDVLCTCQLGVNKFNNYGLNPYLLVDIVRCDHKKMYELVSGETPSQKAGQIIKTFVFQLPYLSFDRLLISGVFLIKEGVVQ